MTATPALRVIAALGLLVVGTFLAVTDALAMLAGTEEPEVAFEVGGLDLSDDDNATALFTVSDMAPGIVTRCITVAYTGDASGAEIRLHGTSAGSASSALRLTVEKGSGGSFGDCTGFSGSVAYTGALSAFSAAHRDFASGLAVVTPLTSSGSVTFRLSMSLADTAPQGGTGIADFTWEAGRTVVVPPVPPTVPPTIPPVPPPTIPPVSVPTLPTIPSVDTTVAEQPEDDERAPRRTGGTETGPASETTTETTVAAPPAPVPAVTPDVDRSSGTARTAVPRTRVARDNDGSDTPASVLSTVATVATEAAKKGAFPTALVGIVIAFLAMQDRIDRKDPKLALAPVYAEADLTFAQRGDELE